MNTDPTETHRNAMAPTCLGSLLNRSAKSKNTRVSSTRDGLVFEERVVRPHNNFKPRVSSIPTTEIMSALYGCHSDHRVPTLEALSIREIFKNVEFITPELLDNLPWIIGKKVWYAAQSCGDGTLSLWRVFAPRYHDHELFSYFRVSQFRLEQNVQEHFADITSTSCNWLTCLTLSTPELLLEDIMAISNISNLVALDICGSNAGLNDNTSKHLVSDNIIRNWGRRSKECDNCFTQLRVLILRNQVDVTERVFSCLDLFPSLVIFGVQGCTITRDIEPLAARHGWTCADETGLLDKMQRDIDHCYTWDGAIRRCVELSEDLVARESIEALPIPKPPLLNYKLGFTSNDVLVSTPLVLFRSLKTSSITVNHEKPRRVATPISDKSSLCHAKSSYDQTPTGTAASSSALPSGIFLNPNRTDTPLIPASSLSALSSTSSGGNTSPCPSSAGEDHVSSVRSTSKRRKVRETKMVDLNDWFDSVHSNGNTSTSLTDENPPSITLGDVSNEAGKECRKPSDVLRSKTRSH